MGCGVDSATFSKCRKWVLFYGFKMSEVVGVESVGSTLLRGLRPFFSLVLLYSNLVIISLF